MFDLAFSELIVIGIVALVVIGPEKLPKVARAAGRMIGQVQRFTNAIKTDLENELRLEDMQRLQAELRQNVEAGLPAYQVGQVIDHSQPQNMIEAQQPAANADTIEPTEPLEAKRSPVV
jgi:sec-independent protein translocase protein TatB